MDRGPEACCRLACRNVHSTGTQDTRDPADLGGKYVDDRLGAPRLRLWAVRHVEAPTHTQPQCCSTRSTKTCGIEDSSRPPKASENPSCASACSDAAS